MDEVYSKHSEYADDASIWSIDASIRVAANQDQVTEKKWCGKWNMSDAADKTEVMVFPIPANSQKSMCQ